MTAVQAPLWGAGWEVEPCADAEPEQRPTPVAYRDVEIVETGELL